MKRREFIQNSGLVASSFVPGKLWAESLQNDVQNSKSHDPHFYTNPLDEGLVFYFDKNGKSVEVLRHGTVCNAKDRMEYSKDSHLAFVATENGTKQIGVLTAFTEYLGKNVPSVFGKSNLFQFFRIGFLSWNSQSNQFELSGVLSHQTEIYDLNGYPVSGHLENRQCAGILSVDIRSGYEFVIVLSSLKDGTLLFLGFHSHRKEWTQLYCDNPFSNQEILTSCYSIYHFFSLDDFGGKRDVLQIVDPFFGVRLFSLNWNEDFGYSLSVIGQIQNGDFLHKDWKFSGELSEEKSDQYFSNIFDESGELIHFFRSPDQQMRSFVWKPSGEGSFAAVVHHAGSFTLEKDFQWYVLNAQNARTQIFIGVDSNNDFHRIFTHYDEESQKAFLVKEPLASVNEHPVFQSVKDQVGKAFVFSSAKKNITRNQDDNSEKKPSSYGLSVLDPQTVSPATVHPDVLFQFVMDSAGSVFVSPGQNKKSASNEFSFHSRENFTAADLRQYDEIFTRTVSDNFCAFSFLYFFGKNPAPCFFRKREKDTPICYSFPILVKIGGDASSNDSADEELATSHAPISPPMSFLNFFDFDLSGFSDNYKFGDSLAMQILGFFQDVQAMCRPLLFIRSISLAIIESFFQIGVSSPFLNEMRSNNFFKIVYNQQPKSLVEKWNHSLRILRGLALLHIADEKNILCTDITSLIFASCVPTGFLNQIVETTPGISDHAHFLLSTYSSYGGFLLAYFLADSRNSLRHRVQVIEQCFRDLPGVIEDYVFKYLSVSHNDIEWAFGNGLMQADYPLFQFFSNVQIWREKALEIEEASTAGRMDFSAPWDCRLCSFSFSGDPSENTEARLLNYLHWRLLYFKFAGREYIPLDLSTDPTQFFKDLKPELSFPGTIHPNLVGVENFPASAIRQVYGFSFIVPAFFFRGGQSVLLGKKGFPGTAISYEQVSKSERAPSCLQSKGEGKRFEIPLGSLETLQQELLGFVL